MTGKKLAASLFAAVEAEQGFAFISDGMDDYPPARVIAVARGSLYHSRRVVRQLEQWLALNDDRRATRYVGTGSGKATRKRLPLSHKG